MKNQTVINRIRRWLINRLLNDDICIMHNIRIDFPNEIAEGKVSFGLITNCDMHFSNHKDKSK